MRRRTQHVGFLVAVCISANRLAAQSAGQGAAQTDAGAPSRGWRYAAEVGATAGTTWLSGATAPSVKSGAGILVGASAGRELHGGSARPTIGAAARATVQSLQLKENAVTWSGGSFTEYDALATLTLTLPSPAALRVGVQGGAGAAVFAGARDVQPFRSASSVVPRVEGAVIVALAAAEGTRRDLALVLRYGAVRITPSDAGITVSNGWSGGVSAAVRVSR